MQMEVILVEDVPHLGDVGQLVKVARGFARNYLLPQNLAILASLKNRRQLEHQKREANHRRVKSQAAAEATAGRLRGLTVRIARKVGEQDKLYGSVTSHDVAEALAAQGVVLDRRKLELAEPIKALGEYKLPVRISHTVQAELTLTVVAE